MIPVINSVGGSMVINESALQELRRTNCTMPDVDRVIYNLGTKRYPLRDANGKHVKDENGKFKMGEPVKVLATVVYFIDDTKVSVVNSVTDAVDVEKVFLDADGKVTKDEAKAVQTVEVATKDSKERGLVYAMIKRMFSTPDKEGKMVNSGLGRILNKLNSAAYDENLEAVRAKLLKAKTKKEHDAKIGTGKDRTRYSINDTLAKFNKVLDKVLTSNDKDVADTIRAIFKD